MAEHDPSFDYLKDRWHELGGPFGRINGLLYEAVRLQGESVIQTLEPGKAYTARQICGEGFWAKLIGPLEARHVGMCLRDLVNRALVDLSPVQRKGKSKYPLLYQRK